MGLSVWNQNIYPDCYSQLCHLLQIYAATVYNSVTSQVIGIWTNWSLVSGYWGQYRFFANTEQTEQKQRNENQRIEILGCSLLRGRLWCSDTRSDLSKLKDIKLTESWGRDIILYCIWSFLFHCKWQGSTVGAIEDGTCTTWMPGCVTVAENGMRV